MVHLASTHDGTWGEEEMFFIWLLTCFAWAISAAILGARRDRTEAERRDKYRQLVHDLTAEIEQLKNEVAHWQPADLDEDYEEEVRPDWPDEDSSGRRRSMSAKEREEWLKRQQHE